AVYSVVAAAAEFVFGSGADGHGSEVARRCAARCGLERGQRRARSRRTYARANPVRITGAAAIPDETGPSFCDRLTGAGGIRNLWRGLAYGSEAAHGDRHSHGAGSEAGTCAPADAEAGNDAGAGGPRSGRTGGGGDRTVRFEPVVPGES